MFVIAAEHFLNIIESDPSTSTVSSHGLCSTHSISFVSSHSFYLPAQPAVAL